MLKQASAGGNLMGKLRPDTRAAIAASTPLILSKLCQRERQWQHQVLGIGSRYHAIGCANASDKKAKAMRQFWLRLFGSAQRLGTQTA